MKVGMRIVRSLSLSFTLTAITSLVGCSANEANALSGTSTSDAGGTSSDTKADADSEATRDASTAQSSVDANTSPSALDANSPAPSTSCSALAGLHATSFSGSEIDLAWSASSGVTFVLSRKSNCGGDDYAPIATLPSGTSTYADKSVSANYDYWYKLSATDSSAHEVDAAIAVQAAATQGAFGCNGVVGSGATSGVDANACVTQDASAGPSIDASSNAPDSGVPAHYVPDFVTCIGDSITNGVGASGPGKPYEDVMQGLFGSSVKVGGYGTNGATMMKVSNFSYWYVGNLQNAEAFVKAAGAGKNVAVTIMLGTNDSKDVVGGIDNWNSTAPQRYHDDYIAMIEELQALTPKPLVFLVLPPPAFSNSYDIDGAVIANQIIPIIRSIAAELQLPLIDVHDALTGGAAETVDGVHPNDMGHAVIAQTMYNAILSPSVPAYQGDGGT
jgi:acyl-CoA thioesterase-1